MDHTKNKIKLPGNLHVSYRCQALLSRTSTIFKDFLKDNSAIFIYVIGRLGGPYSEKLCPRSQFFTIRTDPKPDNNMFIFFSCGKLAY